MSILQMNIKGVPKAAMMACGTQYLGIRGSVIPEARIRAWALRVPASYARPLGLDRLIKEIDNNAKQGKGVATLGTGTGGQVLFLAKV